MIRSNLAALILLVAVALAPAALAQWDVREIGGRQYVAVDNMKKVYSFNQYSRRGKSIVLENQRYEVKMKVGSHDCFMNNVKFVLSYAVTDAGGRAWISQVDLAKLIDPVLRPSFIQSAGNFRTVILDPGHGGSDPGATNSLGTEARYNLEIARRVKHFLEKEYRFRVIMTRDSNHFLTLQQRVAKANQVRENAVFVSIHHNSAKNRSARGIETFTLSPVGVSHYGRGLRSGDFRERTGNKRDHANVALATSVHGSILSMLNKSEKTSYTLDRGIKRARFNVLTGVKHPAILVECGFMTHPYEARLIHDEGYQNTVAKSIAFAIEKYRYAVSGSKVRK